MATHFRRIPKNDRQGRELKKKKKYRLHVTVFCLVPERRRTRIRYLVSRGSHCYKIGGTLVTFAAVLQLLLLFKPHTRQNSILLTSVCLLEVIIEKSKYGRTLLTSSTL